jgi:hypothetical protein
MLTEQQRGVRGDWLMSRRAPAKRRPASAQADSAPPRFSQRLLSRPVLTAVAVVLAIGCGVLCYLVAAGKFGDNTKYLSITSCTIGAPGCVARAPANIHADFAVFINGEQVNFDQSQYAAKPDADSGFDAGGKTIVAHKQLTTWDSFFRSVGMQLSDSTVPGGSIENTCLAMPGGAKYCQDATHTFKFYVNGVKVDGIDNTNINDLDGVLISYGTEKPEQVVANQLPKLTAQACQLSNRCAAPAAAGG